MGPTLVSILQMRKVRFRKRKAEPNLEMHLSSSALEQFASTPASHSLVHLFIICLPSLSSLRVGPLSCAHRCIPRNWLNACLWQKLNKYLLSGGPSWGLAHFIHRCWAWTSAWILILLLRSCVILDKLINFAGTQFLNLWNTDSAPTSSGLW